MTKKLILMIAIAALLAACSKKKEDTTPTDNGNANAGDTGGDDSMGGGADDTLADGEGRPNFDPIYFELDSDVLKEESRVTLQRVAEWMESSPEVKLTLEGHADERGADEYNVALGDRRARAAKDYLVRLGVPEERIRVVSYGEARPAVEGEGEDAWSQNRRGEFVLRYGDTPN